MLASLAPLLIVHVAAAVIAIASGAMVFLLQIERLSPKPKQQLLSIIDALIAAEQNCQGPRS